MKMQLENYIKEYVKEYPDKKGTKTRWEEPLIAFANASDEKFKRLKAVVTPKHGLPQDFLFDAKTVIAYFLPLEKKIVESNIEGKESSEAWGIAYIETNQLIHDLNSYIYETLKQLGYESTIIPATHNFDEAKLVSQWSHRHIAYIAGLGKFGLNNMLITEKGSCGRVGSIVTNLMIEATEFVEDEFCLYRAVGSCKKCITACVNGSLQVDQYNRHKCYEMCLYNDKNLKNIGVADVCGKCTVGLPCSLKNPIKKITGY